jgi:hypothetical protein
MSHDEFWDIARVIGLFVLAGLAFTTCRVLDNIGTDPDSLRIGPMIFDRTTTTNTP